MDTMKSTATEITIRSGQRFRVALDDRRDDPIVDCMRSGSIPEPDFMPLVLSALHRQSKAELVVDVGCHVGIFTLPLAAAGYSVLAIDANTKNINLLDRAVALNHWTHVTTRYAAVSDHAGYAGLVHDGPYGIVVEDPSGGVPAFTLDELVGGRPVSLIKLDVEGSEPKVVRGAINTLTANENLIVICESNRPLLKQAGSSPQELWGAFGALGFRCYEFFGSRLIPRSESDVQERTVADFIAVRSNVTNLAVDYAIGKPTIEDSVSMFLTDVSYGHRVWVLEALQFAQREVLADPRIADVLEKARHDEDSGVRGAVAWRYV